MSNADETINQDQDQEDDQNLLEHFLTPLLECNLGQQNGESEDSGIFISDSEEKGEKRSQQEKSRRMSSFTEKQKCILNEHFLINNYPDKYRKETIAEETGLTPKDVSYWFNKKREKRVNAKRKAAIAPVTCEECGKVLADQTSLNRHMMIHTGEKPFKCPYCDRFY